MGIVIKFILFVSSILALYVAIFHSRDEVVFKRGRFRLLNLLSRFGIDSWFGYILPTIFVSDDMIGFAWLNLSFVWIVDENDEDKGSEVPES